MTDLPQDFTVRRPTVDDAQTVLDMMIACDIAEYGEPDSSLDDLLDEWGQVDLAQDAWLVFSPDNRLAGYAIVFNDDVTPGFDFYAHPACSGNKLQEYLLAQCEARAQLTDDQVSGATITTIISQVNKAGRLALESAGYEPRKYYFRMLIALDALPPAPVWPEGCTLRTIVPGQDDQMVYDFIQTAFERPGRRPPSFESWRDYMMRPDHFTPELWFLLFDRDELIGASLCYDYPEFGWVRQLGVASSRRRQGIGSALLQHTFHVFAQRGHKEVALAVDSERPTAQALYENVGMKCVRRHDGYYKTLSNR